MRTTTRRAALRGAASAIAAVPALAMPALAAGPDPIFAAIERARQADEAFGALLTLKSRTEQAGIDATGHLDNTGEFDAEEERLSDALSDAYWDLINTVPTTLAGVLAVIGFALASRRTVSLFPEYDPAERDLDVFLQGIETAVGRHSQV